MKELSQDVIKNISDYLDNNLEKLNITKDDEEYYYFDSERELDPLTSGQIQKILSDEHPLDELMEIVDDMVSIDYFKERDEKIEEIMDGLLGEDCVANLDDYEEETADWLEDHLNLLYNYDNLYNQEVCIDIIIDTGDGNYDFTLNSLHERVDHNHPDEIEKYLPKDSGLLWLIKQQGYSGEDIINIVNSDFPLIENELLQSVIGEIDNTTTHMNALVFLVRMRLENAMDINTYKQDISIEKDTTCGLYDPWHGAGGSLEIKLEKDAYVPWEFIDSAQIDGYRGYSIKDIYGVDEEFWISRSIK